MTWNDPNRLCNRGRWLWLSAALYACACAARAPAPQHTIAPKNSGPPSASVRSAGELRAERAQRKQARWAEYYTEVMERTRKHGGIVIWLAPPQVVARKARQ